MRTIIDITKDDKGYDLFFSLTDYNGEAVNLNGVSSILFKTQSATIYSKSSWNGLFNFKTKLFHQPKSILSCKRQSKAILQ